MRFKVLLSTMILLIASYAFSFEEVRNLNLSAEGIEKLEIDCGAGFLEVRGSEGLKEMQVTAEIIVKGLSEKKTIEYIQEKVELSLEKRGKRAALISKFKSSFSFFSFRERVINLTVNMPKNMSLYIDDGSGYMMIENIEGEIEIDDGSGEIRVEKIKGNMIIDDGSGEIDLKDIWGDVSIEDGSGEVEVKEIQGDVSIDDSSGSIYVEDVQGGVIVSDGSGSINIDGVGKDVVIKRDGSGSVNISNVKGRVIK